MKNKRRENLTKRSEIRKKRRDIPAKRREIRTLGAPPSSSFLGAPAGLTTPKQRGGEAHTHSRMNVAGLPSVGRGNHLFPLQEGRVKRDSPHSS